MSKRKLDPYTLRYVARAFAKAAREQEPLSHGAPYHLGRWAVYDAWASMLRTQAKSLESASRKKAAK